MVFKEYYKILKCSLGRVFPFINKDKTFVTEVNFSIKVLKLGRIILKQLIFKTFDRFGFKFYKNVRKELLKQQKNSTSKKSTDRNQVFVILRNKIDCKLVVARMKHTSLNLLFLLARCLCSHEVRASV